MKMKRIKGKKIPIRLPLPVKTGGPHRPKRGGGYNRERDRNQAIRNWRQGVRE